MRTESEKIIQQYKDNLREDGKSPRTIESYIGDIKGFVDYLRGHNIDFDGRLRRQGITSYRSYLLENGYKTATINKKINNLLSFSYYLINQKMMDEIVVSLKKDRVKIATGSERQVETYDEKQLERLFYYISGDEVSRRDKAIVLTLLYTGVRVSELCSIKLKNIDFLTGHMKVVGKGGKEREIPLKEEVTNAFRDYLKERAESKYSGSECLFLGQRGVIQRDAVNTLLEKHTKESKAGTKLKPHTFRHTFCTRLMQKGVPLTTISKLAGHSNIETTAKFYINASKEEKQKAVNLLENFMCQGNL